MKDDSWQEIADALEKRRAEAEKRFKEAEVELKKANDKLKARERELAKELTRQKEEK